MFSPEKNLDLLSRRNQALQESLERTRRIYEKAVILGIREIYVDYQGEIRIKKTKRMTS